MSREGKERRGADNASSPLASSKIAPGKRTQAEVSAGVAHHEGSLDQRSKSVDFVADDSSPQRAGDWVMDASSLSAMGLSSEPIDLGYSGSSGPSGEASVCAPARDHYQSDEYESSGIRRNVSTGSEGSLLIGTTADLSPPKAGINLTGFIDHSDGSFLRAGAAEAGAPLLRREPLPAATRVFVSGVHPDTSQWWYVTAFLPGEIARGYVQDFRITTDLPEPTAKLHQIQSGDKVEKLAAQEFSSAVRDGHDLRFYENVLLKVNRDRGRAGISGGFQDPGLLGGGNNNIQLVAGHRIWLVSPSYAHTLENVVPDGSLTNGAVAKAKRFAGHLEDLLASVTRSPSYLDEVAGELAQSIREHLAEIIGVTAAFLVAESVSIAAAASPTGVGQLLAFLIQAVLATLGAAGMVEAAKAALGHGSQWMNIAWTASGNDERLAAASREFLRMLVALAMAVLSYNGTKANAVKSASILGKGGGAATPVLIAGGNLAREGAGVVMGPPNMLGGVGAGGMMMEFDNPDGELPGTKEAEGSKSGGKATSKESSLAQSASEGFSTAEQAVISVPAARRTSSADSRLMAA